MTNVEVFTAALRKLYVLNEIQTASAEQAAKCLESLNNMMETWLEANDIELGYYAQTMADLSTNCPVQPYSLKGVIASLAVGVAADFGASVSTELATEYTDGYASICKRAVIKKMRESDMSHLPRNRARRGDILYDT